MKPAACLALMLAAAASPAVSQDRPYTPSLTCAAVRDIVARRQEGTAVPAFMPTRDEAYCLAGFRCRQRMNEGSGTAR